MRTEMRITLEKLKELNFEACDDWEDLFEEKYGEFVDVTSEMISEGHSQMDWFCKYYPEFLERFQEQLKNSPDSFVRQAIARYSDKYHEQLKDDPSWSVRRAVARYNDKYHEQFKDDDYRAVRVAVAKYSDKYHEQLKDDPNGYVRQAVKDYKKKLIVKKENKMEQTIEKLNDLPFSYIYKGLDRSGYLKDTFEITINGEKFPWFQGMGHRVLARKAKGIRIPDEDKLTAKELVQTLQRTITVYEYECGKYRQVIKPPSLREVLYCLITDGEAMDYTFVQWCDNLGYNSDSIQHKSIYDQCLNDSIRIRQVLGSELFEYLRNNLELIEV